MASVDHGLQARVPVSHELRHGCTVRTCRTARARRRLDLDPWVCCWRQFRPRQRRRLSDGRRNRWRLLGLPRRSGCLRQAAEQPDSRGWNRLYRNNDTLRQSTALRLSMVLVQSGRTGSEENNDSRPDRRPRCDPPDMRQRASVLTSSPLWREVDGLVPAEHSRGASGERCCAVCMHSRSADDTVHRVQYDQACKMALALLLPCILFRTLHDVSVMTLLCCHAGGLCATPNHVGSCQCQHHTTTMLARAHAPPPCANRSTCRAARARCRLDLDLGVSCRRQRRPRQRRCLGDGGGNCRRLLSLRRRPRCLR